MNLLIDFPFILLFKILQFVTSGVRSINLVHGDYTNPHCIPSIQYLCNFGFKAALFVLDKKCRAGDCDDHSFFFMYQHAHEGLLIFSMSDPFIFRMDPFIFRMRTHSYLGW